MMVDNRIPKVGEYWFNHKVSPRIYKVTGFEVCDEWTANIEFTYTENGIEKRIKERKYLIRWTDAWTFVTQDEI